MVIKFSHNFKQTLFNILRACGYIQIRDRNIGKESYVKRAGVYRYPRFHLYVKGEEDEKLILNLHLDQKEVSYEGQRAHSGEYEGEVVELEGKRIKEIFEKYKEV